MKAHQPIGENDIAEVLRVQAAGYRPELNESEAAFRLKLRLFPEGCWALWDGPRMAAYVFAHPWTKGRKVLLDSSGYELPSDSNCMYIHDLCVSPESRGSGAGSLLVLSLVEVAERRGLDSFALVAVQESEAYWRRWGFIDQFALEYGAGVPATYMLCEGMPRWK